ncbi:MAG: DUF4270 domain-containing protein [Proteiniphilum sp.]|uniref:DUF4270 domain-containing protein n=1 Tax=Proteiniphilum sp. TaxID=1926877 RepID=UPI00092C25C1|nr:DUF4270 domain-containing protein [Proteiniphilum sp.]MEA5128897.1 DUF4270 domain-containing protein [Proteiniphilum sp.]OJV88570.1 MAG: hypothetical protein BGO34_18295 [Bacteroidia bacterium 44-10]
MKFRFLYRVIIIAIVALSAASCNENLDQIGFTIQPDQDRLAIGIDTLKLQARTIQVDSIFSKTQYPVLGEYTDPVFGSIKSEYIGEFYFSEGAGFYDGAIIDSVRVQLAYTTMMGDSLSPMGLSVYEVTKSLQGISNYSHIDPTEYADMSAPLGTQTFTGKNSTYRTETSSSTGTSYTVYEINVMLPNALGEKFLSEYKKDGHGQLVNVDEFRKFFPGLYFTTTFGKSTILNISLTSLLVHYNYLDKGGSSIGEDTTRTSTMALHITPEVTQINHIQNKSEQLLEENSDYAYVKSPAGVITEITFPLSEMKEKLKSQALNLANFTIYAMPDPDENSMVKLSPPNYLLLVNKDSLAGFFENRKLRDNVTSFLSSGFDTSTYSYQFGNISTMINHYNEKLGEGSGEFDLVYYLIPVDATYVTQQSGYYGSTTSVLTTLQHQMWPTAARLDKREGNLKLDMIFSNF